MQVKNPNIYRFFVAGNPLSRKAMDSVGDLARDMPEAKKPQLQKVKSSFNFKFDFTTIQNGIQRCQRKLSIVK